MTLVGSPVRCRMRKTTISTPISAQSAPSARRARKAVR
jgi:hypothetical protein